MPPKALLPCFKCPCFENRRGHFLMNKIPALFEWASWCSRTFLAPSLGLQSCPLSPNLQGVLFRMVCFIYFICFTSRQKQTIRSTQKHPAEVRGRPRAPFRLTGNAKERGARGVSSLCTPGECFSNPPGKACCCPRHPAPLDTSPGAGGGGTFWRKG